MKSQSLKPLMRDIVLFEEATHLQEQNCIKNYLNYLKFNKLRGPFKFCYVQSDYQLIESMTLRENMYLDSLPLSLTQSRDSHFHKQLKGDANPFLIKLINGLTELDSYPIHAQARSRKILGLVKSLLQEVDYLFLDEPEKHLDADDLNLFIQALQFQLGQREKMILLSSPHKQLWMAHATKIVSRNHQKHFYTDQVPRDKIQQAFLRTAQKEAKQDESNSGLRFNFSEWDQKKSA